MTSYLPNCKSRSTRFLALTLALCLLFEIAFPSVAYGLTGGPSQPEVESFEPIGTTQMVDPFSGDFTYNIGLLDVDGYPINISYHSGITTDQEASWVGLGWNINPGNITRSMRGMPDDFSGDLIKNEFNMKPNKTWGVNARFGGELLGFDKLSAGYGFGINYNTYNGVAAEQSINFGVSMNLGRSGQDSHTANLGLGLKSSSSDGLTISPNVSYSKRVASEKNRDESISNSIGIGTSINSKSGLKALSIDASRSKSISSTNDAGKSVASVTRGSSASSTSITFTPNTYIPSVSMPFKNNSYSFSGKVGGEFFGVTGTFNLVGYFSSQTLEKKEKKANAYGYLNLENALTNLDPNALMDFNREKEVAYNKHVKNLPVTNMTYDLFNITGQGINGMFRSYRNDIPAFYDARTNSTNDSKNFGGEAGLGNTFQVGLDFYTNSVKSNSGVWSSQNPAISSQKTAYGSTKPDDFEPSFFKQFGEMVPEKNTAFNTQIGNNDAVRVPIKTEGNKYDIQTEAAFQKKDGSKISFSSTDLVKQNRSPRNQFISYLKASEVSNMGITRYTSPHAKSHHIGQVWVTKTDGARYVYGLPAYNTLQKEVSFNVAGKQGNCETGLVNYDPQDASIENNNGSDGYFNSTTLPPYAHSFLLTAVVSADYVDLSGDGVSDDDLGAYTEFKYKKIGNGGIYKWRVPFPAGQANYSEGLKHDPSDDRASYVYGEKEVWYLDTIKSSTQLAIFHTSNREDAYEAAGEHGGMGTARFHKLDSISLYSKYDFYNSPNPVPIKRVHFKYSYTLCPGIDNGNSVNGKLTLDEVFFTYGNSRKGAISPYKFVYADLNHDGNVDVQANPDYNVKAYDRWGNYKPNEGSCEAVNTSDILASEFPYTSQDRTIFYSSGDYQLSKADVYAQAWSLTSIQLPSGGIINVDYESDDYAYVQDKPAMQMFSNITFGSSSSGAGSEVLYDGSGLKRYVFFDVPPGTTTADVKNKYLRDIKSKELYFRIMVQTGNADNTYEYVSGYCKIDPTDAGVSSGRGFVKVKDVKKGDWSRPNDMVHPMTKAAWNFVRSHNPRLANGVNDPKANNGDVGLEDVLRAIGQSGMVKNIKEFFDGANTTLERKGYGKRIISEKSWIRLYNPDGKKYGGGSRVKKITVGDQWLTLTGDNSKDNFEYGQEFIYENEDGTSSGVASYEPMPGGDENPFRMPIFIREQNLLAPDGEHYLEEPFGESYFPSPSVGYGRVMVKNISHDDVNRGATGFEVMEFYTAKDFPTKTSRTALDPKAARSNSLSNFLNLSGVKDYMNTTQGYAIELNDMHGKPKSVKVYGNADDGDIPPLISGSNYKYATTLQSNNGAYSTKSKTLDNRVTVIKPDGTIQNNEQIGVEYDIATDYREHNTFSENVGINGNLNAFFLGLWPVAIPLVLPSKSNQHTRYRSVVTTKVTNRFGILREVESFDMGTRISKENIAWDSETGEVLLTKVNNQFNDPVYNLSLPAHWGYDGMGQAYKNAGVAINLTTNFYGKIPSALYDYFTDGDLVLLLNSNKRAWVQEYNNELYLIDQEGEPMAYPATYSGLVKVIQSGRGNQQGLSIFDLTSRENPLDHLDGSDRLQISSALNILNSGATEYKEEWQVDNALVWTKGDEQQYEPTQVAYDWIDFLNALISNNDWHWNGSMPNDFWNYWQPITSGYSSHFPVLEQIWFYWDSNYSISTLDLSYQDSPSTYELHFKFNGFWGQYYYHSFDAPYSPFPWDDIVSFSTDPVQYYTNSGSYYPECTITLKAHMQNGSVEEIFFHGAGHVDPITYLPSKGCVEMLRPINGTVSACSLDETINPFLKGVRGNYKPSKSYSYITERSQSILVNGNVNSRDDGTFESFDPFWSYSSANSFWEPDATNWTLAEMVTKRNRKGLDVEGRDALGIYSSALHGFGDHLPVAVASNSRYNEMGYDGFEDYDALDAFECRIPHFKFENDADHVYLGKAHTGKRSLRLAHPSEPDPGPAVLSKPFIAEVDPNTTYTETAPPYTLLPSDYLHTFNPIAGTEEDYVLSFWVARDKSPGTEDYDYANDFSLAIQLDNGSGPVALTPTSVIKSEIIDDWQQFTYRFTLPNTTAVDDLFQLSFNSTPSGSYNVFIDDVRIHPNDASMKSYVYDYRSLRFIAELDENNFATFYEYDQEGKLIRIKRETEKGILTVKESRNNSSKTRLP